MRETTLCYIEKDGKYLMLHRVKKAADVNKDKWIGIGGHLEEGETPEECLLREVKEETGLTLTQYRFCGDILFSYPPYPAETMYLYHAAGFEGNLTDCDEGDLCWLEKEKLHTLPAWEGDFVFLRLMEQRVPPFHLELYYSGNTLSHALLNGTPLPLPGWEEVIEKL